MLADMTVNVQTFRVYPANGPGMHSNVEGLRKGNYIKKYSK